MISTFIRHGLLSCVALLPLLAGCTSTSGLLFRPGPHKLLWSAEEIAAVSDHPLPIPRETAKGVLSDYLIEPGDVLLVEVTDFNSPLRLPGDQTVQPDGTIDMGQYGTLQVAGKTIGTIEAEARQLITAYEEVNAEDTAEASGGTTSDVVQPERDEGVASAADVINVRLVEPTSKVYYVTGEVNSPGAYPLIGRETVLDAIIEAGDLTDRANRHKIILSRPSGPQNCRMVLPVCYRHIVQLGDSTTNYQIQPGDRIFVSSLTFWQEIGQSLFPHVGQECPHCSTSQQPCPQLRSGVVGDHSNCKYCMEAPP
jgi:polysaccharide export outer membrane protein